MKGLERFRANFQYATENAAFNRHLDMPAACEQHNERRLVRVSGGGAQRPGDIDACRCLPFPGRDRLR